MHAGTTNETVGVHGASGPGMYAWYVIFLLTLVNLINYMDRMALAILAPLIKMDLSLSDTRLGLLIGFAFASCYAICGIPIARWADRGTRRTIIAAAVATWSVMTALCGAAQSFWTLFLARMGVGAGEAGSFAPGSSLLCDLIPWQRRASAFGITTVGIYLGLMAGMFLAGTLGQHFGWRRTFLILGLLGLPVALLLLITLREPKRGALDLAATAAAPPLCKTLNDLWQSKAYRLLVLAMVGTGYAQFGLNQWWPSFFTRSFGLSVSEVGTLLGLAIGLGSGCGALLGGFLANRLAIRDVRLSLLVGSGAVLLAVPPAFGSLFSTSAHWSMIYVGLTAMFWSAPTGPMLASIYSVTTANTRATAGALYILAMSIFGIGLGPLTVGILSDGLHAAFGLQALRVAMLLPICFFPLVAIALHGAAQVLSRDLQATR